MLTLPRVPVPGLEEDLSVESVDGWGLCICYKKVPLWQTSVGLSEVTVFLCRGNLMKPKEPYSLCCFNHLTGRLYKYGEWYSLIEAAEWLEEPYQII